VSGWSGRPNAGVSVAAGVPFLLNLLRLVLSGFWMFLADLNSDSAAKGHRDAYFSNRAITASTRRFVVESAGSPSLVKIELTRGSTVLMLRCSRSAIALFDRP
jgi:hypothetical protein